MMALSIVLRLAPLVLLMTMCRGQSQGQGQDATRQLETYGTAIVNSVIGKIRANCIFSEDRLFLRRTAYVMTQDGKNRSTYQGGFHGGIWRVTETMFRNTKNCGLSSLTSACRNISTNLNINWPSVQWQELRRPLYSGLAVALYTLITLNGADMPGDVSSQADLWGRMYNKDSSTFLTETTQAPLFDCKDKLDLVFILDSSSSVSPSDFLLMKQFAAYVVNAMNVSLDAIRVADIVYSSSVSVHFDFDDHASQASANSSLLATPKLDSGTNTAAALDLARTLLSDQAGRGARANVKKVAVLVTDGFSDSFFQTTTSAANLKDDGTTVFAIGVGHYNLDELIAVATAPTCTHVMTLKGFEFIDSIVTEIQKSTCEASITVPASNRIERSLPEGGTEVTALASAPPVNKIIVAEVSCGILNVYVSTVDPRPGPTVFDNLYTATSGAPAVLWLVESLSSGTPVYITVVGIRLPDSLAVLQACSHYTWSLGVTQKTMTKVICEENGLQRDCTDDDIKDAGFCLYNNDLKYPVENPCTLDNLDKGILRHSYPYDPTKFLQCDLQGQYYITLCPGGVIFNQDTRECGFASPGSSGLQDSDGGGDGSSPDDVSSVCTSHNLANNNFFHAYAGDSSKFIQCDNWGRGYLISCAPGTTWDQVTKQCAHANTSTPPAPATTPSTACTHGQFYPNVCEPQKYYQCVHGVLITMSCPVSLYFNVNNNVCDSTLVTVPPSC